MGWMVNATPRPLYPRKTDSVAILWEAGWTPGSVWTGAENLAPTGIRSPARSPRSESLYRLSYRGELLVTNDVRHDHCAVRCLCKLVHGQHEMMLANRYNYSIIKANYDTLVKII
jgi:hypothetical protein